MHRLGLLLCFMALLPLPYAFSRQNNDRRHIKNDESLNKWIKTSSVDQLTDSKTEQLSLISTAVSNGRKGQFQVTITCEGNIPFLEVGYFPDFQNEIGFKYETGRGIFGSIVNQTFVRSNVGGKIDANNFPIQYTNVVKSPLDFASPLSRLLSAPLAKLEFTLENGDTPMLALRPQDPTVQDFMNQPACKPQQEFAPQTIRAPEGFLTVLGISPPEGRVPRRQLILIRLDRWEKLIADKGQDGSVALRQLCQADISKCNETMRSIVTSASARSGLYRLSQSTMEDVDSGTYQLIYWANGDSSNDVRTATLSIRPGPNSFRFSSLH
jgi:hypothetical protein